MSKNRERENARNGVIRGGGVHRSKAQTRAITGGNGRKKTNRERLVFQIVVAEHGTEPASAFCVR